MAVLEDLEAKFGLARSAWTKADWKRAALELAERVDGTAPALEKRTRGRPKHDGALVQTADGRLLVSQRGNYAALAFQVQEAMEEAARKGRKLEMKTAVRQQLVAAIQRHNTAPKEQRGSRDQPVRISRADEILETAYTEVRKLLKPKKTSAATSGD